MKVRVYEKVGGDEVLVRDGRYIDEAVEHFGSAEEVADLDRVCDEAERQLKAPGRYWLNRGRYLVMPDRTS